MEMRRNPAAFLWREQRPDFNDCHTILYGHNMKNGSMFGSLKQYKNDGFYEKNAYFTVFTEDAAYRYQIFTYSDVPEDSDVYTTGYLPDETFDGFLTELLKSSYKDTGVAVGKDDKVLTLSTCSGDGLRFVVHAVRVDEHERGVTVKFLSGCFSFCTKNWQLLACFADVTSVY